MMQEEEAFRMRERKQRKGNAGERRLSIGKVRERSKSGTRRRETKGGQLKGRE